MKIGSKGCIVLPKLAEEPKKFVRFYWEGDLYQFLCLYFGLAAAPYIFTKSLEIPIIFPRRIGTLITSWGL